MNKALKVVLIGAAVGMLVSAAATAQQPTRGFGFGGSMLMAFFPDMTGVNTFMSENGLPSMGDMLIGGGGNGRGGVIGGPVFGGAGWGLVATSEAEGRRAELVFGGGGFDMGHALAGDRNSVLTLGAVLGGGANVLAVTTTPVNGESVAPSAIVIEPTTRELGRAVGFIQPYLSMAAQLLPWMGFEFRLGYVFPLFGFGFGDDFGIPAPRLDLSGPTVSFGITFGGIASIADEEREGTGQEPGVRGEVTLTRGGSFSLEDAEELVVENAVGDIFVESYRAEIEGTAAGPIVEWSATVSADETDFDQLQIESDVSGLRASVKTAGEGRVDYRFRVPVGVDLKLENGTGDITILGHETGTIVLESGMGDVVVDGARATALVIAAGVGSVHLRMLETETLVTDVGIGDIVLDLDPDASATLALKARLGDVSIDRFPGMIGGVRGFLGKRGDVTLGNGDRRIELTVGVGSIEIHVQER